MHIYIYINVRSFNLKQYLNSKRYVKENSLRCQHSRFFKSRFHYWRRSVYTVTVERAYNRRLFKEQEELKDVEDLKNTVLKGLIYLCYNGLLENDEFGNMKQSLKKKSKK